MTKLRLPVFFLIVSIVTLCGCTGPQLQTATAISQVAAKALQIGIDVHDAVGKLKGLQDPENRAQAADRLVAEAVQLAATNEPDKVEEAATRLKQAVGLARVAQQIAKAQGIDVPPVVDELLKRAEGALAAHAIDQFAKATGGT